MSATRSAGAVPLALLVALTAAFAAWIGYVVATDQPLDFYAYYLSGAAIARGLSPYELSRAAWSVLAVQLHVSHWAWPYRYPPYTAALFVALRPLGRQPLLLLWLAGNAAAFAAGAWLVGLALGGGRRVALALGVLLACAPAYDSLDVGQINGLLFLALAIAFWGLSRRRDGALGAGVAAAAGIKVIPVALLAWLVWRGRWRALAAALATLGILTLLSLPIIGAGEFVRYAHHAVDLARPESVMTGVNNVTLTGLVGRAFPAAHAFDLLAGRVAAIVLVVATAALCWPPTRRGETATSSLLEFGLIVAVLPLLPPFTWFHQLALCLIPLLLVVDRLLATGRRGLAAVPLTLFALTDLFWLAWITRDTVPAGPLFWLAAVAPAYCLGLWLMLGALLVQEKRRAARAPVAAEPREPSADEALAS